MQHEHPDAICTIEEFNSESGRAVDVSVMGKKKIAVEISISGSEVAETSNLIKDEGFDEIIVAARDMATLNRLKIRALQDVPPAKYAKVKWELLRNFLTYEKEKKNT